MTSSSVNYFIEEALEEENNERTINGSCVITGTCKMIQLELPSQAD